MRRAALGLLAATVSWLVLVAGITLWRSRGRGEPLRAALVEVVGGQGDTPWRTILAVTWALLALAGVAISLASHYHLLGTDQVGQDVFYKSLKSIRTGLVIGTLTTLVMLPFALVFGWLLPRLGGRCHPVHLHDRELYSQRVADRGRHPEFTSVYRHA